MANFEDDILTSDLPAEELIKRLYDNPNWVSHVDDRLRYREYDIPENEDESIDMLVSLYTNKKSRRVSYAGKKLKAVFNDLPPVEQRKVGMALLTGSRTDSEWVCQYLDSYKHPLKKEWIVNWHPCYAALLEESWNKYHGYYCGKLMVLFLDEKIVRKYIDELTDERLYISLCRRFVNRPWFKLDVEKLKACTHINAYLYIMSKAGQDISAEEARSLLYQWIAIIIIRNRKDCKMLTPENLFWSYIQMEHGVINTWGMNTALYYLLKMGHKKVVKDFVDWGKDVARKHVENLPVEIDNPSYEGEFCQTIYDNFPEDLKYLLYPNLKLYNFIESPGQPFTKPRKYPWVDESRCFPAEYLPLIENEEDIMKFKTKNYTKDDFDRIVYYNPSLQLMMDKFDLSLISAEEDEEAKPLSDYELYLKERDLPF